MRGDAAEFDIGQRINDEVADGGARLKLFAAFKADLFEIVFDLLDDLDVEDVNYDPDGFDDRVKEVRQQLKKQRRGAGGED